MKWEFPVDPADQFQGFSDPGVETFRSHPYGSLAREILQNSLDARRTGDEPVRVEFTERAIKTADLPDIAQYKGTMRACFESTLETDKKAQHFFRTAIDILEEKRVTILSVSEVNTTGIPGPCERGRPYY